MSVRDAVKIEKNMCGICGIKGLVTKNRHTYISDMLNALHHRGPDEEGRYFNEDISLGIRRLSIIDLKTGSQPIFNEDKSIAVVCNGELYNFNRLRDMLVKKGHNFYTNSDVEVLGHLYEEYGFDCVKFIKGMFSFALWDNNKKSLFVARDRFGIKPLYYYYNGGIFAFASELKALLKLPFINKQLNVQALDLYFSLEYIPSPYSIFKNIHKLKPAHYIIYSNNGIKTHRYWNIYGTGIENKNKLSFHEAGDKFIEILRNSVKEHLISDVPLGFFLSGGIDSSTLVAVAKELYNKEIFTFTIDFEERSFDESKYASLIAQHFETNHHSYVFTINDFIDNFYNMATYLDEPFADLSIFPLYMLSKFSHQHIKVALSGEGADELFMGYPTYAAHKYMYLFNKFPRAFKRIAKYIIELLPTSFEYFSFDFKLKKFAQGIDEHNPLLRHISWMGAFSEGEKELLFSETLRKNEPKDMDYVSDFIKYFMDNPNTEEIYKFIQHFDFSTYLPEDLLVKSDRASMCSSLEVRVPYLDHKLVEFICSLDHRLIYQKKLLKSVMGKSIPSKILSRKKKGFPIPFSKWLQNERFLKMVGEFFDKGFIDRQGLFNYSYVNFLLNEHLSSRKDNRKKIRTYIMFQSWYKCWYN